MPKIMPQQDITAEEARYLYLQLHSLLATRKSENRNKKGISKKHDDIYVSGLDKLVTLLEDWHNPDSSRYLLLNVEKRFPRDYY